MGVTDNVKTYLKPKEWLIIGGVVQLGFAIWLMMDAARQGKEWSAGGGSADVDRS